MEQSHSTHPTAKSEFVHRMATCRDNFERVAGTVVYQRARQRIIGTTRTGAPQGAAPQPRTTDPRTDPQAAEWVRELNQLLPCSSLLPLVTLCDAALPHISENQHEFQAYKQACQNFRVKTAQHDKALNALLDDVPTAIDAQYVRNCQTARAALVRELTLLFRDMDATPTVKQYNEVTNLSRDVTQGLSNIRKYKRLGYAMPAEPPDSALQVLEAFAQGHHKLDKDAPAATVKAKLKIFMAALKELDAWIEHL